MKPVAFFDIDGTVFRSSLLIELVEALIAEGHFPESARTGYQKEYSAWRNREGSYEKYANAVVEVFYTHLRGLHYGVLADVGVAVVNEQRKHVYRYTRTLLSDLKRRGYVLVAISQSPKTVIDQFCSEYGFDKMYGRIYEIGPTDRFTGEVAEEHLIQNKANIVTRVFNKNPEYTKTRSIAVGDTEGDISLLEAVDRPICFNPNRALYDYALRMDWEVVVERKDVIYHL